jgi:hypothetical protein
MEEGAKLVNLSELMKSPNPHIISPSPLPDVKPDGVTTRWGSPKNDKKLEQIRRDGIPKMTQKQTSWALSVWSEWASYRCENIIKESEMIHSLVPDLVSMSKEAINFWLRAAVSTKQSLSNLLWFRSFFSFKRLSKC